MNARSENVTPGRPGARLVDVSGDGSERGAVHGEELRDVIAEALESWRDGIGRRSGHRPDTYVEYFLGATGYVAAVAERSPDLYAEVLAIAAASNQPANHVLAYNFMDEQWLFDQQAGIGCSVLGTVLPGGDVLLSQNMDLPRSMGSSQVALRITEQGRRPEQIILTAAGMIGLFGVNISGLACCVNALTGLPSSTRGIPVAFVVRELLMHHNTRSAARHLASIPHASGQHYAIADRHGVRGFECSAKGCHPGPPGKSLLHTNHPLWWDAGLPDGAPPQGTTHTRLRALQEGLAGVRGSGDAEALLGSGDLCMRPSTGSGMVTFCSASFTLTSPPTVRVALGRPDQVTWQPVGWCCGTV